MHLINEDWVKSHVRPRNVQGHKKSFGHVLVIAGSEGKAGAAILCARAALHSGCGMVTAVVPDVAVKVLLQEEPAIMYASIDGFEKLNLNTFDAIAIGPGLGFTEDAKRCLLKVVTDYKGPIVIDADALTMMANNMEWVQPNQILTPHPGEFARLSGTVYDASNREGQAKEFVEKFPCTLVLKGAGTLVATLDHGIFQNTTGNDGMATAGAGDVLSGIIAALCAQGYAQDEAACLGVFMHGMAGDLAIKDQSKASLVATDLIHYLGKLRYLD